MSILIDNWRKAKNAREIAEEWNSLPDNTCKYGDTEFNISIAHSSGPVLIRTGQMRQGGNSIWKTESEFNKAILKYIVDNWDGIYPSVLKIMKDRENNALLDCQEFISEMQDLINSAGE